jgi:hypothetical protein
MKIQSLALHYTAAVQTHIITALASTPVALQWTYIHVVKCSSSLANRGLAIVAVCPHIGCITCYDIFLIERKQ